MANPELTVVGGANGCGKTTFALEYSRQISCDYLQRGCRTSEIRPDAPETASVAAGKEFLRRVRSTVDSGRSLIIESTLAGRVSLRNTLHRARSWGSK